MKLLWISLLILATGASSHAQTSAAETRPLPAGAWPAKIGDSAHWTVETVFAKPFDKAAARDPAYLEQNSPRIVREEVQKTKSAVMERLEDEVGSKWVTCTMGARQVSMVPGLKQLQRVTPDVVGFRNYVSQPWPDLAWIRREDYTGVRTVAGTECAIFQNDGRTAALDLATHLPVMATSSDATQTYKFLQPPASPLAFPPAFAAEFAAWEMELKRMKVNVPIP